MALTTDESYSTVAEADTYWDEHNDALGNWTAAATPAKEKALREATQYIDKYFDFPGILTDSTQPLSWPRSNAYDSEGRWLDGVPDLLKDATAELAAIAVDGTRLIPMKSRDDFYSRVKAGSVEVEFDENSPVYKKYDYVFLLLRRITRYSHSTAKLVRV